MTPKTAMEQIEIYREDIYGENQLDWPIYEAQFILRAFDVVRDMFIEEGMTIEFSKEEATKIFNKIFEEWMKAPQP